MHLNPRYQQEHCEIHRLWKMIRHADALPLGEGGVMEDSERPLSDVGKAQVKTLAAALQRSGVRLGVLVTSPLLRAKQTAEELVKHWSGPAPSVQECEALAIGGKSKKLTRFLNSLDGNAVGLVGHQPDLCELAVLVDRQPQSPPRFGESGRRFDYLSGWAGQRDGDATLAGDASLVRPTR